MKVHLIYKYGLGEKLPAVMVCATKEIADRELARLETEEKFHEGLLYMFSFLKDGKKDKWFYSVEMEVVE